MQVDNIQVREIKPRKPDPLAIAYNMQRRPSYVQSFCILQCVAMSPKLKVYQVARMLGFDYYQAMKRITELSKKGFLKVVNGSLTITNEGIILKEILGQLIALLHSSDVGKRR
jgi:predicted transcriptional regulator